MRSNHQNSSANALSKSWPYQSNLPGTTWIWRQATRWLAIAILSTIAGCGTFSKPAGNPPLAADLREFAPLPEPTGDKGRDALRYATELVAERERRRSVVATYCENADPC